MSHPESHAEAVIDVLPGQCSDQPDGEAAQVGGEGIAEADKFAALRTAARRRRRELYAARKPQFAECVEQYRQTAPLVSAMIRAAATAGDDRGAFAMAAALLDAVVRTRVTALTGVRYSKVSLTHCIAKLASVQNVTDATAFALMDAARVVAETQEAKEKPVLYAQHAAYVASVAGMFAEGAEPVMPRSRRRWAVRSNHAAATALEAYATGAA